MSTPTPADELASAKYTDGWLDRGRIQTARAAFLAGIAYERDRAERDVGQVLDIAYGREVPK